MADRVHIHHRTLSPAWLKPRFWPTWLGLGVMGLSLLLPAPWRRRLGREIGRRVLARNTKRRAIIKTNLEWCLPEYTAQHERITRDYFGYAGQTMLDLATFWWSGKQYLHTQIAIKGEGLLRELLGQGRRIILVTPHTLQIDFGGIALSTLYPLIVPFNQARNPLFNWCMEGSRSRFHAEMSRRERGLRPILRSMEEGRILYFMVDEDLGTRNSVFAPFFGVEKATITSPARMAKMMQAVVIPCITWFDEGRGRYLLHIDEVLGDFPSGNAVEDALCVNQALERLIRLAPEQYMWSLRTFQTFRDGSPPPYTMKGRPGSGPRPPPAAGGAAAP